MSQLDLAQLRDMARVYRLIHTEGVYYPRMGFPLPTHDYCRFALDRARKLARANGSKVTF